MPWTVEYGYARTKEEQDAPPPGMMMKAAEAFPSKRAAMDDAGNRIALGATIVFVKDADGEVVADINDVWTHMHPTKPDGA